MSPSTKGNGHQASYKIKMKVKHSKQKQKFHIKMVKFSSFSKNSLDTRVNCSASEQSKKMSVS